MAVRKDDRYEVEELLNQPGTYFNPQTEVLVVVDDSASLDQEVFNLEDYEGADWIRVSEEIPVDEDQRDEVLETFQTRYHGGAGGPLSAATLEEDDEELARGEEKLDGDEDEDAEEDEDEDGPDPGRED